MIAIAPINITLSVDVLGKSIMANLIFRNDSSSMIHLDSWAVFTDNDILNNYFEIKNDANQKIRYKGMMAYRKFKDEDFIEFKSNQVIMVSVPLDEVYAFEKGRKYTVKYNTFHPTSLQNNGLMILQSNTVEITY
jgi:hypothetical protein